MIRNCVECDAQFDTLSKAKRQAGGLSTVCPECSEETTVRYAGISAGEGKQASVQVLKFKNADDRKAYLRYWAASSGLNTGKQCQLGIRAREVNIQFETKATFTGNTNHKGKD